MVDTGVDKHPGLQASSSRATTPCATSTATRVYPCRRAEDDGSFDPDDGNQHGTACTGMARATGLRRTGPSPSSASGPMRVSWM